MNRTAIIYPGELDKATAVAKKLKDNNLISEHYGIYKYIGPNLPDAHHYIFDFHTDEDVMTYLRAFHYRGDIPSALEHKKKMAQLTELPEAELDITPID